MSEHIVDNYEIMRQVALTFLYILSTVQKL